jgi:hypothetical protein
MARPIGISSRPGLAWRRFGKSARFAGMKKPTATAASALAIAIAAAGCQSSSNSSYPAAASTPAAASPSSAAGLVEEARHGCAHVVPAILTPGNRQRVSGTVDVTATVAEGGGCVISARTLVSVYSQDGTLLDRSFPLDLGDVWHWDTTQLANGRYRLRAAQNCCNVPSAPIQVKVRN